MPHASLPDSRPSSTPSLTTPEQLRPLRVQRLGVVPYAAALELQQQLVARRRRDEVPDHLLLLEHSHVITMGTSARREHVLADEAQRRLLGLQLFQTGRGGDVTYHGPGQLVGYPVIDLKPDRCDLHRYLRDLEQVLIQTLAAFGIDAVRKPGLTGVWMDNAKIAAIGVRVSSGWISSHGFALNVDPDLRFFTAIVPCGIHDHGVTSMRQVLGCAPDGDAVAAQVVNSFSAVFNRAPTFA